VAPGRRSPAQIMSRHSAMTGAGTAPRTVMYPVGHNELTVVSYMGTLLK